MKVQDYVNSNPQMFNLLTSSLDTVDAELIEGILPLPLTAAHQWYLFKYIRHLCTDMQKADEVAPKPHILEPKEVEKVFKKEVETKRKMEFSTSNEKEILRKLSKRGSNV